MKCKRITAAILMALMLTACGENSEPAVSETAASQSLTETAELTTEAAEEGTSASETTELTTSEATEEITSTAESTAAETSVELKKERHFELYEPEIYEGCPSICDISAIMARRREDMAEKYTSWTEDYNSEDYNSEEYENAADFAEKYFGYSFDKSAPVCSYVEDDFDLDGKTEYYLCMAEYTMVMLPFSISYAEEFNGYDTAIVTSIYYIDDDGAVKNVLSKLVKMSTGEYLFGDTAEDALNRYLDNFTYENNLKFQIEYGYGSLLAPVVIDNGDSKHLLWKNEDSYPTDFGAYIFGLDKHCRVEISAPSSSLGGFYQWGEIPEELFWNEREKFGEDFWATQINLATKMDLYSYPEVNGKVNTMKWDGQNYVYDIVEENPYAPELKSGPVEWN